MRSLPAASLLMLLAGLAKAAIWPDPLGPFQRVSAKAVTPSADQAIWDEYGFREAETAQYEGNGGKFTATAYLFQDPTDALAAFDWLRPAFPYLSDNWLSNGG